MTDPRDMSDSMFGSDKRHPVQRKVSVISQVAHDEAVAEASGYGKNNRHHCIKTGPHPGHFGASFFRGF